MFTNDNGTETGLNLQGSGTGGGFNTGTTYEPYYIGSNGYVNVVTATLNANDEVVGVTFNVYTSLANYHDDDWAFSTYVAITGTSVFEVMNSQTNEMVADVGQDATHALAISGYSNSNVTFTGGSGTFVTPDEFSVIEPVFGGSSTCFDGVNTGELSNMGYSYINTDVATEDQYQNFSYSNIMVYSENLAGTEITGYYQVLRQDGNIVSTGFTPAWFETSPTTYTLQADNYSSCIFRNWTLDGSSDGSSNPLTISPGYDPQYYVANYNCAGITVDSVNQEGDPITGYYTTLYYDGTVIQSGYTPVTFTLLTEGDSYIVDSHNYGSCTFEEWQDTGSTNNERTVIASYGDQTFTAIYDCT